ncbi:MAG: hypothetical protein LBL37_07520 [Gracilibacteraceae bacterium]|nr:hypothetical protein [Gracilibacteraceae bacterium]
MSKNLRKLFVFTAVLLLAGALGACGAPAPAAGPASQAPAAEAEISPGAQEHPVISYRRLPTASTDLFEAGIIPILEKQGYQFQPLEITDPIQRETALSEDELDMHVDAHTAYINNFNREQGTELAPVLAIPTVPTGVYPGRKDNLADIAAGDSIAFPDDASNEARSLYLLSNLGLLTMREGIEPTEYTLADIAENPLDLDLVELNGSTIAPAYDDFAYIILRGSDAYNSGTDFKTALATETQDAILPDNLMQVVVNGPHKDDLWVRDIIAAFQSDEFKAFLRSEGDFWILPDYLR